jgi:hypothetical protein
MAIFREIENKHVADTHIQSMQFPGTKLERGDTGTVSIVDEEVEGVSVASVGEAVVPRRQPLQALRRDVPEVAGVGRVLRHHHRAPRHHRVYQRRRCRWPLLRRHLDPRAR